MVGMEAAVRKLGFQKCQVSWITIPVVDFESRQMPAWNLGSVNLSNSCLNVGWKNKRSMVSLFNCEQEVMSQLSLIPQIYNMLINHKVLYFLILNLKKTNPHNCVSLVYASFYWHKNENVSLWLLTWRLLRARTANMKHMYITPLFPFSWRTSLIDYDIHTELSQRFQILSIWCPKQVSPIGHI